MARYRSPTRGLQRLEGSRQTVQEGWERSGCGHIVGLRWHHGLSIVALVTTTVTGVLILSTSLAKRSCLLLTAVVVHELKEVRH